jgi:hypothetical protein
LVAATTRTSTRVRAAHPLELPLLEHAQELGLELGPQVADLVEIERTALGQLEASEPPLVGVGERAALVAEQLGLEQRGRDRRARDGDERLAGPAAVVVDRARDHLLAGAGLTPQQDADLGPRDAPDGLVDLLHPGRFPDQGPELPHLVDAGTERHHLARQRLGLGRTLDQEPHLVVVERLGQVVVGAALHGLHGGAHAAVGGHDDHRGVGRGLAQLGQRLEAVDPGHADVEERQVERLGRGAGQRGGAVLDHGHRVPGLAQEPLEQPADGGLVVGHQDPGRAHADRSGR